MIPRLRLCSRPKGLPKAKTFWPSLMKTIYSNHKKIILAWATSQEIKDWIHWVVQWVGLLGRSLKYLTFSSLIFPFATSQQISKPRQWPVRPTISLSEWPRKSGCIKPQKSFSRGLEVWFAQLRDQPLGRLVLSWMVKNNMNKLETLTIPVVSGWLPWLWGMVEHDSWPKNDRSITKTTFAAAINTNQQT